MTRLRPRKPSASMVVALIALMVALGGTSYAAITLPKNSVGTKQLKKNAVTTAKIKNHAVTAKKINPAGLTVPHATTADSSQAIAYAHVGPTGTLDTAHSKNVSAASSATTGVYCLKVTIPVVNATATADAETGGKFASASVVLGGQDPHGYIGSLCPAGDNVIVGEMDGSGSNVNQGFWISFN